MTDSIVVGFDLDQTLVDSRPRIEAALRGAFGRLGGPVSAVSIDGLMGLPLEDTVRALWPEADLEALVPVYRALYDGSPDGTRPLPGAASALAAVRRLAGRNIVVSAKFPAAVRAAVHEAGLADLVDDTHGGLFAHAKAEVLTAAGASIYVGDSLADMAAALAAGARPVGVATGSADRQQLLEAGADVVLADLTEFENWLGSTR